RPWRAVPPSRRDPEPLSSYQPGEARRGCAVADDDWAPPAASPLAEITGTGPRPAHDVVVPGFTDLREVARGGDAIVYRARPPGGAGAGAAVAGGPWAPPPAGPPAEIPGAGPRPAHDVVVPGFPDLREVARGGDAIVYRARQPSVDRDVAIKVFQVTDPADAARFRRELEITVRLGRQHPHIVTVIDTTTTTAGAPCLVMEFHDLGSLHDRLRETGPLPVSDVVAAGTAVADALAFAHAHGVLHRDVKPQNVLVLPTSYVLSDFGIARVADAGHTATLERFSYRHA